MDLMFIDEPYPETNIILKLCISFYVFYEISDVLWGFIKTYSHKGLKSKIPVNKRNQKNKKKGRLIKVDQEEYKKKSVVERFFNWIESFKKAFPRY